jgi:hypothetical protein
MNKGQIRAHFKALLNRTDCDDALADTFIDQAITRIQRTLRIPSMEKTQNYAITSQVTNIVVPNDLIEIMSIYTSEYTMSRVTLREMKQFQALGEAGTPKYFCRQGEDILLYPFPANTTVSMDYYSQFDELTSDTSENSLTIIASDLVTYTALSYAADYFLDERGPLFEQKAGVFITEIQEMANEAEQAGSLQSIRPSSILEE